MFDKKKVEELVYELLSAIGEDPDREGLVQTPKRVANAYAEILTNTDDDINGYYKTFEFEGDGEVMQNNIEFHSMCEHHMLPFFGTVHIAYKPQGRVIGLSKLSRIVEHYAKGLQLQERLNEQIASSIYENLKCEGVIVIIEAKHLCMSMRGVRKSSAITKTISCKGIYEEDRELKKELINLLMDK